MRSSTYYTWAAMKERCYNPNHPHYSAYGGAGVHMCARWRYSFSNFVADMGERPEGLTIDRLNGSKLYSKETCRWATKKEQARQNRRMVTIGDETLSMGEWAAKLGLSQPALNARIKRGWSLERALTTP